MMFYLCNYNFFSLDWFSGIASGVLGHFKSPGGCKLCPCSSSWTRGKLLCPKCRGRLGSFDFTMQPKCRQGLHMLPSVHLVKSRVDRSVAAPPVARVKPFLREEGLWSNATPETGSTQDCPAAALKSAASQNCFPGTNLSGSGFQINMPQDSARAKDHLPPNCPCSSPEAACFSKSLVTVPTTNRVNTQNHSHTCCLANSQCIWPLVQVNKHGDVFKSHPASPAKCTNDDVISRGKVQCCHHSCLSESWVHSEHPTRNHLGRQPIPGGDESTVTSVDSCQGGGGNFRCSGDLSYEVRGRDQSNHSLIHGITDSLGSSRLTNAVRPEIAPLPQDNGVNLFVGLPQEDQDDFLLEWDNLEELEEINSSMLSYQMRADARREKNRRKRVRRKLRRQGNAHRLFLEGDLKSLPPSKFEELTGLSLGDRSVQEYTICVVCLDLFVNPRACSPCGHLFCEQCLRQLTRFNPTSTPCPLCRTIIEVTVPHEGLSSALQKLFPYQTKQKQEAYQKVKQFYPLPRAQNLPSVWLPLFSQRILSGRNRQRMFWSFQPNSSLDYHDFGRLWVQTLRWRFMVAGYGLLALLLVCACSVLVINFV